MQCISFVFRGQGHAAEVRMCDAVKEGINQGPFIFEWGELERKGEKKCERVVCILQLTRRQGRKQARIQ